jgi:hypothetical protein
MKTTKIVLLIAILSFATLSYATVDPGPVCVKIHLKKAMQNHRLVRAMYEQLDMSFLQVDQNGFYVARVAFNHSFYFIYGTYEEWISFFTMDLEGLPETNSMEYLLSVKPVR